MVWHSARDSLDASLQRRCTAHDRATLGDTREVQPSRRWHRDRFGR